MKRILPAILVVLAASAAVAKNVDLVTLPKRDSVQLTIYNSEDITLVKETRHITLKRGANKLQFSWAGTLIDPSSVEFRPLEHADKIEVADTVFPGQKPQHLYWNIHSRIEGQVKVEVTYFTSGLTWRMDYVAIADPDETVMQFRGYVRVFNRSGEPYENAEIRMIVGTINLVEKISVLARRRGLDVDKLSGKEEQELKSVAYARAVKKSAPRPSAAPPSVQPVAVRPPKIVKEGVSEYFMFAVEGTQTIPNGWSKRMRAVKADGVKFKILYRMRAHQYGGRPVRFYIWQNDDEHKLGESPLPDGRVRLFRDNGKDGLAFLGEQQVRYVPIKAKIEINTGPDDLVVYETKRVGTERLNFEFRRDSRGREWVTGWDERTQWVDTLRNFRTKPITLELRRIWHGDVDYVSEVPTKLFDYRTAETTFTIKARDKVQYPCTVTTHNGSRAKQSRIKLKKGR